MTNLQFLAVLLDVLAETIDDPILQDRIFTSVYKRLQDTEPPRGKTTSVVYDPVPFGPAAEKSYEDLLKRANETVYQVRLSQNAYPPDDKSWESWNR